jgi:Asp-tRNA(Asn)/Glu-tRNA(Gln) amidotransferase A subunit family amidase
VAIGNAVSGVDLLACDKVRAHALAAWEKMFIENNLSAFILPTAGSVAPEIGAAAAVGISDSGLSMKLTKHIFMANFIGVPAITVPFSDSELPLGMQVVGTHWGEADLFEVAEAIEARIGG